MKLARSLGIGAWASTALLSAACGSVVVASSGDTTGGGSLCPAGGHCIPQSAGNTGSSGSTGGVGGASTGKVCGPNLGSFCAADEFCFFADHQCGGNDANGVCTKRPQACDKNLQPTCACDQKVYDNPCDANQAGFDQNAIGGCALPPGMFACGPGFCQAGGYFCRHAGTNNGPPDTYTCEPFPASCGSAPSCGCLDNVCGNNCQATPGGGFVVTCFGA